MTKPRCILPGRTYLVTRRCSERRFLLRPDPLVTQLFEYLLAYYARQHGIQIHAFVVMSNHYHLVVTDVNGTLPDFQRDLNSVLARAVNKLRCRSDSFWDRKSYNAVDLLEDEDMLSKMAYTLANPVAARLVDRARQWTGATSAGMAFGERRTIARPKGFFRRMPEHVELELTRPPCYVGSDGAELSGTRLGELLSQELGRREEELGKLGSALGMEEVMRQRWNDSPNSPDDAGSLRPTVAGRNKWARIEALRRSKEWLDRYAEALAAFRDGVRDVCFPPGTWWMCKRLKCACASP